MFYTKNDTTYNLIDGNGNIIFDGEEVSICFDKRCGTLFRHGPPLIVRAFYHRTIDLYKSSGNAEIANDLVVITSSHWDVDVLNKCINTTGWVVLMVQLYQLPVYGPIGDIVHEMAVKSAMKFNHPIPERVPKRTADHQPFPVVIDQYDGDYVSEACDEVPLDGLSPSGDPLWRRE